MKMNSRILSLTAVMVLTLSASAATFETDRTWYLAGERMTVSVTADDALIAYAELCDTHGLAAGVVVGLEEGEGEGVIELPSDLHSGYYVLSVYTRGDAHVSQRLIAVVNSLHKSEDDDIEWVKITHPDSLSYEGVKSEELRVKNLLPPFGNHKVQSSKFKVQSSKFKETEGHIIMARIRNVADGQTIQSGQIRPALSVIGKKIHYFEGEMIDDTTAVFYTYGIRGRQPIVLCATSLSGISLPIEMISPFATLLPDQLPHLVFHYQRSEVEARSLDMQRERREGVRSEEVKSEEVRSQEPYDETAFGTMPDLTYNLDEYRQFLTIREVLTEYVSCVRKKKVDGIPQLSVRKESDPYDNSWPTLVLIDGMPVFDVERLLNYDARRVHYINIYGGQYTFGNGLYNGILSFVTRSGQLTNYPVERNMQYLEYGFPE